MEGQSTNEEKKPAHLYLHQKSERFQKLVNQKQISDQQKSDQLSSDLCSIKSEKSPAVYRFL